jgi:hypothetical protein
VTNTKYTISAANRITGKSRTTILKHIRQGRLSCELDGDDNKVIDRSELIRAYGAECDFSREEGGSIGSRAVAGSDGVVQQQLHTVQQQLDMVNKERERERSQFQQQIDNLQDSLKLAQETANKAMLLLENRSGVGEWQKPLKQLEERLASHESSIQKAREETRGQTIKEIKDKPFWQLLFLR